MEHGLGISFENELNHARLVNPIRGKYVHLLSQLRHLGTTTVYEAACGDLHSASMLQS